MAAYTKGAIIGGGVVVNQENRVGQSRRIGRLRHGAVNRVALVAGEGSTVGVMSDARGVVTQRFRAGKHGGVVAGFAIAVIGPGNDHKPTGTIGILVVYVVASAGSTAVGSHREMLFFGDVEYGSDADRRYRTVMAGVAKIHNAAEGAGWSSRPEFVTLRVVRNMAGHTESFTATGQIVVRSRYTGENQRREKQQTQTYHCY